MYSATATVDRIVKDIRELLRACAATQSKALGKQVLSRHAELGALLDEVLIETEQADIVGQAEVTRCDRLLEDDALAASLVSLLHRLRGSALAETLLSVEQLQACATLMWAMRCTVTRAVTVLHKRPPGSAAERFLCATAAAQPCAALASLMALPASTAAAPLTLLNQQQYSDAEFATYSTRRTSLAATNVALQLLSATFACPPLATALASDTHAPQLLARLCGASLRLMALPPADFTEVGLSVLSLAQTVLMLPPPRASRSVLLPLEASVGCATMCAEPMVARVLLQAVLRWRWGPEDESMGTLSARALGSWLTAQEQAAGGLAALLAVQLTSQDVNAVVPHAAELAPGLDSTAAAVTNKHLQACKLLRTLLTSLQTQQERHRAFLPVAAYAKRVVELSVRNQAVAAAVCRAKAGPSRSGAGSPVSRGRSTTAQPDSAPPRYGLSTCLPALHLLRETWGRDVELMCAAPGGTLPPTAAMEQLQTRARWCIAQCLPAKCEALLRGGGAVAWAGLVLLDIAHTASLISGEPCMLLLGDPRHGAAAQAAHQSMLATMRKVMCCQVATVRSASLHGMAAERMGATRNQQGATFRDAAVKKAAEGGGLHWLLNLSSAVTVITELQRLRSLPGAAVVADQRLAAMQLLPPAVRLAAACAAAGSATWRAGLHSLASLMYTVASLHQDGLADVSAAAGFPGLLDLVLQMPMMFGGTEAEQRSQTAAPVYLLAVLHTAGGNSAWLREAGRRGLLEQVQMRMSVVGISTAVAAALADSTDLAVFLASPSAVGKQAQSAEVDAALVGRAMEAVRVRIQALPPLGAAPHPAASWDDCLLPMLAAPSSAVVGTCPAFFGCCRRRCTNLEGGSEAALPLKKCGGCKLARYCSAACQQGAWRSGHRVACQAWLARAHGSSAEPPTLSATGKVACRAVPA